ncbi:MAG: rhomboid family intramembrane serine protease [Oscillatoriophycideae cyanobacterium NC_groundwater_1537_Pr4_S-0.65um_50_18]|nr:rhomboid family intramembrane serine protease [Oscillatoriophycideae cyanobacterium NC_groundwater_1537_Pr4_S-0.65um_50_18]
MDSEVLALLRNYLETDPSDLSAQVRVLGNLLVITWAIHTLDWAFRTGDLDGRENGNLGGFLGIHPREITGLPGVVCAHFLHGLERRKGLNDNSHIIGNSMVFAVLGLCLALQGVRFFYVVSIAVLLSSGIGTWLFGRPGPHVGASGVLFGYMGFLMTYGFTSFNIGALLVGFLTLILYSRLVVGIFPQDEGTSWEMHLFGFLGGVFMALVLTSLRPSF